VDFGSNEVFLKTSAYIGCIVAQRADPPSAEHVRVIDVEALPPRFVATMLLGAEEATADHRTAILHVYFAQHPRGSSPWILLSHEEQFSQVRLEDVSERLDSVAGIFQGIRTGANDIFIVDTKGDDEEFVAQVVNGLGESGLIERALLRPVVFGSEVGRYDLIQPTTKRLLYPYLRGIPVSEPEMERAHQFAKKYLDRYREILASRSSILASGLRWYELVRKRDEDWLSQPKLLIRDLAPQTSFAADPSWSAAKDV